MYKVSSGRSCLTLKHKVAVASSPLLTFRNKRGPYDLMPHYVEHTRHFDPGIILDDIEALQIDNRSAMMLLFPDILFTFFKVLQLVKPVEEPHFEVAKLQQPWWSEISRWQARLWS